MPRYYFHIHDGRAVLDTEGTVLPDLRAAQLEAIRYAAEVLKDEALQLKSGEDWHMDVLDGRGLLLFRIDFCLTASTALMPATSTSSDRASEVDLPLPTHPSSPGGRPK